jgi:glycosyltransferase involved in cell wall biosynthesis
MTDTLKISFAIPFYGSVEYLDRAIASVRKQTIDDWTLVVVDDCSPSEGARGLVENLGDARITYFRNDHNLGLAGNWNRCIDLSRTPLVTLLHSDDELCPRYAEMMLAAHAKWPHAGAIFCRAQIIDEQGEPVFSLRDLVKRWLMPSTTRPFELAGEEGTRCLLRGNFVICPSLCYKRSAFDALRFSTQWRFMLDLDFLVRGLMAGGRLVGLPDTAIRYRRHAEQVTVECERNLRMFTEEIGFLHWAAEESRRLGWGRAVAVAEKMPIIKLQILNYAAQDLMRFQFGAALMKMKLLVQGVGAALPPPA